MAIERRNVCPHLMVLTSTLALAILTDEPVVPNLDPSVVLNMVVMNLPDSLVDDFLALEVVRASSVEDNEVYGSHLGQYWMRA